jgi:peptide/nickel transport system substrate-binding protein
VKQGRADWLYGLIPSRQLDALRVRFPGRLHTNATFVVDFIALNTKRAPFDDVRVRRALNYAIDRSRIVRLYGGPSVASAICQPLAAGLPGYRPYCPYTRSSSRSGSWKGPNIVLAHRLVAASGTKGMRVDVWGATGLLIPQGVPAYVARVLRSLGYRTRLHLLPYASYTPSLRRTLQLTVDGDWQADYPSPSSYLPSFFGCDGGHNRKQYVCDPPLDRQMQRASTVALESPARANALWERIDRTLVDRAFWVPTVSVHNTELVSRRLGNYEFNPIGGFIADQAWVR